MSDLPENNEQDSQSAAGANVEPISEPSSELNEKAPTLAYPFSFTGSGSEFFKIWIVNVSLTILTLGIYSAWAKVRTNRYFYSHFKLDGEGFEYHAKPIEILKGRLIALALVLAYYFAASLSPAMGALAAIALSVAYPVIIVLSLRFHRRVTSYRNLHFRFHGRFRDAYKTFLLWPLIGIFSLGILYPLVLIKADRFVINNSAYGTEKFGFAGKYGHYGKLFLLGLALYIALSVVAAAVVAGLAFVLSPDGGGNATIGPMSVFLTVLPIYLVMFYLYARFVNLKFSLTTLRDHGFESTLTAASFARLVVSNFFLIIITLGLYLPFAKVRFARYRAERLSFMAQGSLDDFTAGEGEKVSAMSQEIGQAFDFDIGIGI